MTNLGTAALRELYAAGSPVASVYFNLRATDEDAAAPRWRVIADQLAEHGAPDPTISALTDHVLARVPGPGVLAAFLTADDTLFVGDMPGSGQPDHGEHGPLPHLVPLLEWLQDRPAHVVAVVDRLGADIAVYPRAASEAITTSITGPDDEIERNAPGGWSQPRYQHRAEDSWSHNAALVADQVGHILRRHDARLLVLAGDVRALQYLDEHLPTWTRQGVVVRRISGGRSNDGSWSRRSAQIVEEVRRAAADERTSMLAELAEGRHPGGQAVEGVQATLAALAEGRVRTLLLVAGAKPGRTAWFGPGPTDVAARPDRLIQAGVPVERGALTDVAIRAAILTSAEIRVLEPGRIGAPAEGIGALCRFVA